MRLRGPRDLRQNGQASDRARLKLSQDFVGWVRACSTPSINATYQFDIVVVESRLDMLESSLVTLCDELVHD
ncbi:hypothetical protein H5410_000923, partial [Solanum commersonii]